MAIQKRDLLVWEWILFYKVVFHTGKLFDNFDVKLAALFFEILSSNARVTG